MTWSIENYAAAWDFATRSHMGQTYGGRHEGERIPYIAHVSSVAAEVLWAIGEEPGWDADFAVQCALLHDVVEDTGASLDGLTERFGARVAEGVAALTKDKSIASKYTQMDDSLRRIKLQPREIWVVKMCDRITNLYHPPYYWDLHKIGQYREEAKTILAALGSANEAAAHRLAKMISEYPKAE
jgi:(p)ppGpp synthase/HD superfamily hydrolase